MNMSDKTRKILTGIVLGIVVLAMVFSMVSPLFYN